jgi:hypothetical protein
VPDEQVEAALIDLLRDVARLAFLQPSDPS